MGLSKVFSKLIMACSVMLVAACTTTQGPASMHWKTDGPVVNVLSCLKGGGKWLEEHQECEFMGEKTCTELGGTFNECASACRHDENAMVCVMMCVPLCKFEP